MAELDLAARAGDRAVVRRALIAGLLSFAAPTLAAPKVGLIVLSHEGLPEAASDQVASELAVAVATQIEGEARSGASVRDKLATAPADGCEESPKCGRDAAAELEVDEALLLAMHLAGKTIIVDCYRVPRDPARKPTQATLRLLGGKAKRTQALLELVAGLYPTGSAVELAASAPPPRATPAVPPPEEAAEEVHKRPRRRVVDDEPPLDAEAQAKRKKKILFYSLIGGGAAVLVAVAVILGVTLGGGGSPTGASIQLP
jgi:hypothetical protein